MGRPNSCDCRCGGVDPPLPPVTDCENLLCIVFMDENSSMDDQTLKVQKFTEAFPDRVLIVLDVEENNFGTISYDPAFIAAPRMFSLRLEYDDDSTNLIRFIKRDSGSQTIALQNDPWGRIVEIITRNGLLTWFNTINTEVAVFTDNSGSMTRNSVSQTLIKLSEDIVLAGKSEVGSIYNNNEDFICPFTVSECCTGQAADDLADLCGYSWNCENQYAQLNLVYPQLKIGSDITDYTVDITVDGTPFVRSAGDASLFDEGANVNITLRPLTAGVQLCDPEQPFEYLNWHTREPGGVNISEANKAFTDTGIPCNQTLNIPSLSDIDVVPMASCTDSGVATVTLHDYSVALGSGQGYTVQIENLTTSETVEKDSCQTYTCNVGDVLRFTYIAPLSCGGETFWTAGNWKYKKDQITDCTVRLENEAGVQTGPIILSPFTIEVDVAYLSVTALYYCAIP